MSRILYATLVEPHIFHLFSFKSLVYLSFSPFGSISVADTLLISRYKSRDIHIKYCATVPPQYRSCNPNLKSHTHWCTPQILLRYELLLVRTSLYSIGFQFCLAFYWLNRDHLQCLTYTFGRCRESRDARR